MGTNGVSSAVGVAYLDDERLELVEFGALEDGAEGHDGGVAVAPVGMLDVLLDEGQHVRNHVVLAAGGQQHQAHARRLARVPVIIIVILVLKWSNGGEEERNEGGRFRGDVAILPHS